MASCTAIVRLKKELSALLKDPVENVVALPNPKNILEWHYVITGPKDTPYEGGVYHGKVVFPSEYPYKPPSILMLTPSGRFQPNQRICLSMSDYHPETWNPMWSVATIMTGVLTFMLENSPTAGSVRSSVHEKRRLAAMSLDFNLANPLFRKLFPQFVRAGQPLPASSENPDSDSDSEAVEPTPEPPVAAAAPLQPPRPAQPAAPTGVGAAVPVPAAGADGAAVARGQNRTAAVVRAKVARRGDDSVNKACLGFLAVFLFAFAFKILGFD